MKTVKIIFWAFVTFMLLSCEKEEPLESNNVCLCGQVINQTVRTSYGDRIYTFWVKNNCTSNIRTKVEVKPIADGEPDWWGQSTVCFDKSW